MPSYLPLPLQTIYAELVERCAVDELGETFQSGSFTQREVKGRGYWYFVAGRADEGGRRPQRYVGPDSPELRERIARHSSAKSAWRERRQMVTALQRASLPSPDGGTGVLVDALAKAGLFRLRACLIGTVAFQCYAGLLGTKLPGAMVRTGDLDLAQFHAISVAIAGDERAPPILDVLRTVDPSFREVPYQMDGRLTAAYAGSGGYRVEVLVPNRGRERDAPQPLPAIGAMAMSLRFLDYLIYDAVPAVLLHEAGVLVNVPRPERYAWHKLIVSRRRRAGAAKIDKDVAQAATLLEILAERRRADLRKAWQELRGRGPKWRQLVDQGLEGLPAPTLERIAPVIGA